MELAVWLIVGLIVGGAIGGVATWWISRARGGVVSVMQLKKENDKFRDEVAEHFVETARLINQMSESYKQVFDHLSSGAEKLVDDEKLAERLPPATGQEVRLSQFGASGSAGSAAEKSGTSRSRPGVENREPEKGEADRQRGSQTEKDKGKDGSKDAGTALGSTGTLKTGSSQTGAKASTPPAADSGSDKAGDSNGDSSSGETGKGPSAETAGKRSGSDDKASNQSGEGSRRGSD